MAEYRLTHAALSDLSQIWNYTVDNWSEVQADKYYNELLAECARIAKNRAVGKNHEGLTKSLFGRTVNRHIIFYRIVSESEVEITRILHERMDLKNRIIQ